MTEEFRELFRFSKMALLCSGVKIERSDRDRDLMLKWVFYVTQFWLYSCVVGEINYFVHCIRLGAMEDLMFDAPCVTICLLGTAKLTNIFCNADILVDMFQRLVEIFPTTVTIEENNVIVSSVGIFKTIVRMFNRMCVCVLIAFCFLPMVLMGIGYFVNGSTDFKYPFDVYYSVSVEALPFKIFLYLHQVVATFIVCLNIYGADTMFYGCCSFITMHFNLISCSVNNLNMRVNDRTTVQRKLAEVIKRHQLIISLVSKMERLYSHSSLFNFITSSMLICLSGLNITSFRELRSVVAFGAFLVMSLAQIFILCYGGDMVTESSKQVSIAVYNTSWYIADLATKRTILIILMRAQKPCKLTAGGFSNLNIGAFGTVLRRSWSYFAVLQSMY